MPGLGSRQGSCALTFSVACETISINASEHPYISLSYLVLKEAFTLLSTKFMRNEPKFWLTFDEQGSAPSCDSDGWQPNWLPLTANFAHITTTLSRNYWGPNGMEYSELY